MSLILTYDHPSFRVLRSEGVEVLEAGRSGIVTDQILRIAVLNLMPDKKVTELDLLRVLGNTPHPVEVDWITTETYTPKHTDEAYLKRFYRYFSEIRDKAFNGMIITGAPVEHLPFEEVIYWKELQEILDWAATSVNSTLYICWAAQAALFHHFGIDKYALEGKLFGVYEHTPVYPLHPLLKGLNATFTVPHSRYTEIRRSDIAGHPETELLVESTDAGVHLAEAKAIRGIFMTGHPEYNINTLENEYIRDREKGLNTPVPENYFQGNDPGKPPVETWKSAARSFYSNWIGYLKET